MTTAAWIMLGSTWTCVTGFTAYFFLKVLRSRTSFSSEENAERAGNAQPASAD